VKNHERKQRKEMKKNPGKGKKKMSKDPGIPNMHPFKTQLMAQVFGWLSVIFAANGVERWRGF
jgi:hypothetical protein